MSVWFKKDGSILINGEYEGSFHRVYNGMFAATLYVDGCYVHVKADTLSGLRKEIMRYRN